MMIPSEVIALADAQDGIVTRAQILAAGMTESALKHASRTGGSWQRVGRGIYATFTGPLQLRHRLRAALLYAGPEAMVTGAEACRAYGLEYVPHGAQPVILVPEYVHRGASPFVRVQRTRRMPERRVIKEIPVAAPERAVVDACPADVSLRAARALLCEAVQKAMATPAQITDELRSARWPGSQVARRALDDVVVGCRSAPECELRDAIAMSSELGEPLWNVPLPDTGGRTLIPDACWPDARVVVEIDSAQWHRFGDRVEATERRRAAYAALGWTVVPVSPRRLRAEPVAVLAQIEAAVRAGRTRLVAGA
ncbi:type IV toxin-antitoxin system AbiEi family antitoxin domain-containing protein [Phytoactinopolyspora halophila]|nr:type IV toxin-antitoxin system AbiEi family antitoxin domain-containing protein [Phytoactinopolyspora halophila]